EVVFGLQVGSQEGRSTFPGSAHERNGEGGAHASSLPAVLHQYPDFGCVVADVQIAEADAAVATPRRVGIVSGGIGQHLLEVGDAVSDAVEATIKSHRRTAPNHGQ